MKKTLLSSALLLASLLASAQKEDNVWIFGYDSNTYPQYPGTDRINFIFGDSLNIHFSQGGMQLEESSAYICDSSGNLLLLSNGCYIENANGEMLENSDSLNPGWVYDNKCNGPYTFSYSATRNMILLPVPGHPNEYFLFHLPVNVFFQPFFDAYYASILLTKIDMSANNSKGAVAFKNHLLVQDTLHADGIHAVRHANGRDWWVVASKLHSNKYYFLLLTPDGVSVHEQFAGSPTWSEAGGTITFSPDGSKMARFNTRDDLRIFDFDRCSGALYNPIHIPIQDNTEDEVSAGLAFSADGRYLYAAAVKRILQFDLWAPDIAASMTEVAQRDNVKCPFQTSLGGLELAPDGRIYGRNLSGNYCMHRINQPERPGIACDVQQNVLNFAPYAFKNLAHLPNFRLGPLDGSPCDTLGLNNHPLANWRYDRTGPLTAQFTSVSAFQPTDWLWDFGDPAGGTTNTSTEKHPNHTFSAPGKFEVCLTVSNTYGSDTKCKTVWVTTTGLADATTDAALFTCWPNPAASSVHWTPAPDDADATVHIFDYTGRLCLSIPAEQHQADLALLPQGLYFLTRAGQYGQVRAATVLVKTNMP